jgi:predicted ester cyclase
MSEQQNKEIFRSVIDCINSNNYAPLDAIFAADYKEYQYGLKPTLEGMNDDMRYLHTAFPDFHLKIETLVADGDQVWGRMTATGTHQGVFMGRPPTGKPFAITVIDILSIQNGKVVAHWGVPDRFAVMHQLGLLPRPETVAA